MKTKEEIISKYPKFFLEEDSHGASEAVILLDDALTTMDEYASQFRQEPKMCEIDFCGMVKARINVSENKIEVTDAMNGYGDAIPIEQIIITQNL